VGTFTEYYGERWNGVVTQAALGALTVFVVTLVLYCFGKVRTAAWATKLWLDASLSYITFCLLTLVLRWTGLVSHPFGLRRIEIGGVPLGVFIGIAVVAMASYAFVLTFETIQDGIHLGVPRQFAWNCAFALVLETAWLYLELLQFLALLKDD
jgi:uncharacterized YccA/Bax inhibitor family protein